MAEYVEAAIKRGLTRLIFLEHLEVGIDYFESTWLSEDDFRDYMREGRDLRRCYGDKIFVGLGVEVGYNPHAVEEIRDILGRHRWDRVGISYHFLAGASGHLNLLSRKRENIDALRALDTGQVLESYLGGLCRAVEELPGDVLCHLDAALRYLPEVEYGREHHALVDKLLTRCGERGMAVEINTSGIPLRGEPFPSWKIVKRAQEKGLSLVAGSDAHRPNDVGRHFDLLARQACV